MAGADVAAAPPWAVERDRERRGREARVEALLMVDRLVSKSRKPIDLLWENTPEKGRKKGFKSGL